MTLEQLLLELSRYGKVRLVQLGNDATWHCSLELFVTGVGVSMEIKSGFKAPSPMAAAMECSDRLVAALNEMKEQAHKVSLPTIGSGQ